MVGSYLRLRHAIPVNRGRTAIELALRALGADHGAEVVLPSYVCRSVLDAVDAVGARPAFADVGDDLNVTVETIEAALSPRTRCVIVPHLFGRAAPIDQIEDLLRPRQISLIDDAAQALGARCRGRLVGTFGACGIVSSGPGKPLSGAAGGILLTSDRTVFERAAAVALAPERARIVAARTFSFWIWRRLRRYTLPLQVVLDRLTSTDYEAPHSPGLLANLDARILVEQLAKLELNTQRRRQNAIALAQVLGDRIGRPLTLWSSDDATVKLILLLDENGWTLAEVIERLAAAGIESQAGYKPLHLDRGGPSLPRTEALWERVLCIPLDGRIGRRVLQRLAIDCPRPTSNCGGASDDRMMTRFQPIDATISASLVAGVWNPSVIRGRVFRRMAIASSRVWL